MHNLFILPFDHRSTFAKELLHLPYPRLTATQRAKVSALKQIVFDAFLLARKRVRNQPGLAILIDEEFGKNILAQTSKLGIPFALAVEKSGQKIFSFEHGAAFGKKLLKYKPAFAKALIRYNIANTRGNALQRKRIAALSHFCAGHNLGFMLEVLLTGKGSQLRQAEVMLREMLKDDIHPTVWKLEGFTASHAWKKLHPLASAPIIVLGRGEDKRHVEQWIRVAAKSGVVSGFAIGRTMFFKPLQDWHYKKITRAAAVRRIANNYLHFINLWHKITPSP